MKRRPIFVDAQGITLASVKHEGSMPGVKVYYLFYPSGRIQRRLTRLDLACLRYVDGLRRTTLAERRS